MALEWLPRDHETKNHLLFGEEHWGTEAPCTVYEKRPVRDVEIGVVDGDRVQVLQGLEAGERVLLQ